MFNREFSSHMDRPFRLCMCASTQVAHVSTRKKKERIYDVNVESKSHQFYE
jgi:ribosomal protein L31